jgi:hypothetical protein
VRFWPEVIKTKVAATTKDAQKNFSFILASFFLKQNYQNVNYFDYVLIGKVELWIGTSKVTFCS